MKKIKWMEWSVVALAVFAGAALALWDTRDQYERFSLEPPSSEVPSSEVPSFFMRSPEERALPELMTSERMAALPAQPPVRGLRVSSFYGWRSDPLGGGVRHHAGVDLAVPAGTAVYAPGRGRVDTLAYSSSYGLYVVLAHPPTGYSSRLAHLSGFVPTLAVGQRVASGEPLGYAGSTGLSTGPHVHFEISGPAGTSVDPASVYEEYEALRQLLGRAGGSAPP